MSFSSKRKTSKAKLLLNRISNMNETKFEIGDKVKSISVSDDKRWRGVIVEVLGPTRVKLRSISDKKGKYIYCVVSDILRKV